MKVKVKIPGTCGEWIQTRDDKTGTECLVSATIGLYNEIIAYEAARDLALQSQMHLLPKSKAALIKVAEHLELEPAQWQNIVFCRGENALSIGKGMASSTADIAAVMLAVALLKGKSIDVQTLLKLCCTIEPSDGTMLSGLHLIDHLNGNVLETFPTMPAVDILMLLPHTIFETEKLRLKADYLHKLELKSKHPLEQFRQGVANSNLDLMGHAATLSLLENEHILSKRYLAELIDLSQKHQCHGVIGGHSGTVAGIILKKGTDVQKLRFELDKLGLNRYYNEMTVVQTVNGGLTYEVTEA